MNIILANCTVDRLNKFAKRVGLNISTKKTKVMTISAPVEPVVLNEEPLEEVEDFTYLGRILSEDNGAGKDIRA